jgi:lipopolysaccharide/colanic/teichoic acid biosynthesis glycosyltransferase
MIKEKENHTFSKVNELNTGFILSHHWHYRSLMSIKRLKALTISLKTSKEDSPLLYLSLKNTEILNTFNRYVLLKRFMDIVGAIVGLLLTVPISLILSILIKLTSKGSIFYTQKRIGKQGRPFKIYKFRSMPENAEARGPQLSLYKDTRITKVGTFMRRFKLDEIPNFVNVLKGEMALVGYRPERQYYIKHINQYTSHYQRLLQIKPGITSFGQIKFGYASTVDEMVERLAFDLDYLDKMSFKTDLSILLKTLMVIVRGNSPKN